MDKYIYPPRPKQLILPETLPSFEGRGYVAQVKFNGSCTVIIDGTPYNRHGSIKSRFKANIAAVPRDSIVVGEYLDKAKTGEGGLKFEHKFVVFDVLRMNGDSLVGFPYRDRLHAINYLFPEQEPKVTASGVIFNPFTRVRATPYPDIYVANTYTEQFHQLFLDVIDTELYEGVVLKRLDAKLEPGSSEENNTRWQVKVRKPTKNYSR